MTNRRGERGAATTSTRSSTSTRTARSTRPLPPAADPVTAYAHDVVAGRAIACKLAIKACERHLRDLKEGPARGLTWRPDSARYAIRFFGFLHWTEGQAAGRQIRLEPWQQFAIGSVFGWKRADGTRRFRTAYFELPKKNTKSSLCAGVALLGLVADNEPGAHVYSCAVKKDQARIVFGMARQMVRRSPALRRKVGVFKLNLSVDATGSKFEPLSADEKSADGLNPSMVVVDELHRHRSSALRNLMESGMVARRQPLMAIITTAGDTDPDSAYAVENDYALKVLNGVAEDDSYFALICTVDDPAKWDDPGEWAKANPNLGVSVRLDKIAEMAAKAKVSPTKKVDFLRYHLNVRTSSVAKPIDPDVWAANAGAPLDEAALHALEGRKCWLGVDLSSKLDISATVKLFEPLADGEPWIIVPRFFTPGDTLDKRADRDRAPYRLFEQQGFLEATPGDMIDHGRIRDTIIGDARLYQVEAIPYDPWNAAQMAGELMALGLPVVEFIQGLRSYTAPTKEFLAMLVAKRFRHGSNPLLTRMADNLRVERDKNDNLMPTKKHSTGRIDGISAAIMALGAATAPVEREPEYQAFILA